MGSLRYGSLAEANATVRWLKPVQREQRDFMEADLISSPDSSIPHW